MKNEDFYIDQSKLTDPGKYAYLFSDLPDDISELCTILRQLIMHHTDEAIFNYQIPSHRYIEMDARSVENILQNIISLDKRPLTEIRYVPERAIGVCRDISILLCSVLRHKKIPARLRSGFSSYFIPGFNMDGVCVEYWNKQHNRWCIIDSRTTPEHVKLYNITIDFDLHDLPSNKFITAATAWKLCRSKTMEANRFGSRQLRGMWYIRNCLLHDMANINKHEMLIWDLWGLMLSHQKGKPFIPETQYSLLDQIGEMLHEHASDPSLLQQFYQANNDVCVPRTVKVFNPFLKTRVDYVTI